MRPLQGVLPLLTKQHTERFWRKVAVGRHWECWRFHGASDDLYGRFSFGRRTVAAHRVAWMLRNREELGDRIVLHACDHRWCVNPDHLSAGTALENGQDMAAKGRHRNGTLACAGIAAKRLVTNTTLDPSLVAELDEWLGRQPYKVSRAAFIEAAVKRLLAEEKAKEKKR